MKKIKVILILISLWFVIHEVSIIIDGLINEPVKSEYGIIFGNTVNTDGTLSKRLKARTDKGLELYRNSDVKKLFVSGGLGKEGFYEAQIMANYLINNGVLKSDVIIDDHGTNTLLTALNFKKLNSNVKSVVVITQYYHISRAKLALNKVGFKQVSGASPKYFEIRDIYSLFREFFGYYKYLIVY
ncbi:YdcF family protein [Winogradskyella sp. PAMC22761]|nr:YdcF family protein [Winogradskyella sp. PAMC22761]